MGNRPCLSMCKTEEGDGIILCNWVLSLSSGSESNPRVGAGSPMAGSLIYPFPSQTFHYVHPLTQSLLTPYVCRACPVQKFCGSGCCLPFPVPGSPQTLLLFIRAVGKDFFPPWNPPLFFTLPPCPSLMRMCPSWGHGWSREGSPSRRAAKGSGQRRH